MSFTKYSPEDFVVLCKERFGSEVVTKDELQELRNDKISVPWRASAVAVPGGFDVTNVLNGKSPAKAVPASLIPKPAFAPQVAQEPIVTEAGVKAVVGELGNNIPNKTKGFIKWGDYEKVKMLIASRRFYPLFITGLSGNGKTLGIEQACAEAGRGLHRVNLTIETSEDDLVGGFRLINGDSVYEYGPVLKAMVAGDVLLLDEVDLAGPKIMALQSVLEGKGYYIKKLGRWIYPTEGFTVIATANTKGQGSANGMFQFTNVLNEAFLERFKITIEQPYPDERTEKRIVGSMLKTFLNVPKLNDEQARSVDLISEWAFVIRESFAAGAIDNVISTRRSVIIAETYSIFDDIEESVKMGIARFDEETQEAMLTMYKAIDDRVAQRYAEAEQARINKDSGELNPVDFGTMTTEEGMNEIVKMREASNAIF